MDRVECEAVLKKMKQRKEYYEGIEFPSLAAVFQQAAECIETLLKAAPTDSLD